MAQLGERLVRIEEVSGSSPLSSIVFNGCVVDMSVLSSGSIYSGASFCPSSLWRKGIIVCCADKQGRLKTHQEAALSISIKRGGVGPHRQQLLKLMQALFFALKMPK